MFSLEEKPNWQDNKLIVSGLIALIAIIIVRTAWLCDDAYITFRVVDNFLNGFGLVWNISERVQVFTHPLWALILSAAVLVFKDFYYTSIFLSILLSLSTVYLLGFRISKKLCLAIIILLILLTSKAFIEYSTSGLENPLAFLLLAIFLWKFIEYQPSLKNLLFLSLVAAFLMLNRMDTILLCLPALGYYYWHLPKKRGALIILAGFSPMIAWLAFSLVYYGFFLPNTYYAKLHTGISTFAMIKQGAYYFANSFRFDPITPISLLISIILAFYSGLKKNYAVAIGIILYLLYVLRIGGGFMSGRFFGAPLVASVIMISSLNIRIKPKVFWPTVALVVALGIFIPRSVVLSGADFGKDRTILSGGYGITDERRYYYQCSGMLSDKQNDSSPPFEWIETGKILKEVGPHVTNGTSIGYIGFYAGPEVHIIDGYGLTEPLLARLPTINTTRWRIGHFVRFPPRGYKETIETNQNMFNDTCLGEYYSKLKVIVSGEIWSSERFNEIWNFMFGKYDYLISQSSLFKIEEVGLEELSTPVETGHQWNGTGTVPFGNYGLRIHLNEFWNARQIEIGVDNNDIYRFKFCSDSTKIAETKIMDKRLPKGGMRIDTIQVPTEASQKGYDAIEVYADSGDGWNSVASLKRLVDTEFD